MTASKDKKTMTDKAIAANQANAQKSTGPKTPEGKEAVKHNALTYGLYCTDPIIPGESLEEYRAYHLQMFQNFAPCNAYQADLVDNIVAQLWKLKRLDKKEASVEIFASFREDNTQQLLQLELLRSRKLNNIKKLMNELRTTRDRALVSQSVETLLSMGAFARILPESADVAPVPEETLEAALEAIPQDPEGQMMDMEYLVEEATADAGLMLRSPRTMETSAFAKEMDNLLGLLDIANPTPLDIVRHRLRHHPRRLEAEANATAEAS